MRSTTAARGSPDSWMSHRECVARTPISCCIRSAPTPQSRDCARKGWSPIIPHANTGHLDLVAPDLQDSFWLEATMELMRRADAVLLCPGWENSEGTQAEVAEAARTGIPVIHSLHALPCADDWRQLEQIEIQAQPVGRAHGKECSATPAREA